MAAARCARTRPRRAGAWRRTGNLNGTSGLSRWEGGQPSAASWRKRLLQLFAARKPCSTSWHQAWAPTRQPRAVGTRRLARNGKPVSAAPRYRPCWSEGTEYPDVPGSNATSTPFPKLDISRFCRRERCTPASRAPGNALLAALEVRSHRSLSSLSVKACPSHQFILYVRRMGRPRTVGAWHRIDFMPGVARRIGTARSIRECLTGVLPGDAVP